MAVLLVGEERATRVDGVLVLHVRVHGWVAQVSAVADLALEVPARHFVARPALLVFLLLA